jgi:OTU domain-containing protein 3
MSRDATWGGNLELVAASRRFDCHIAIHQLGAPRLMIRNEALANARIIHVAYHDEQHYSSVREAADRHSAEPTNIKVLAQPCRPVRSRTLGRTD